MTLTEKSKHVERAIMFVIFRKDARLALDGGGGLLSLFSFSLADLLR